MAARVDLIAPLEAAFDMHADEQAWMARVVRALEPIVDDDRGTFGWLARAKGDGPAFESLVHMDAPWDETALLAMHADASPEDFALAYPRGSGVHSLAAAYGPQRFRESRFVRRWVRDAGIVDSACFHVSLGERMLVVGSLLREEGVLPASMRRFGATLSSRIAWAFHVRAALAREADLTAVLTPDAKVVHAEGAARTAASVAGLREAVIRREKARGSMRDADPARALHLFDGLASGRFTIMDRFESDGRRYLVAYENPPDVAAIRALTARERTIFERAMRGEPVKRVALDLGIAPSTAGAYLAAARRKTGLRSRGEMARWFRHLGLEREAGAEPSAPALSPAELAVARLVAEGLSNAEIARARGTAVRTVANQLASIYAKVGVGSRVELIASMRL